MFMKTHMDLRRWHRRRNTPELRVWPCNGLFSIWPYQTIIYHYDIRINHDFPVLYRIKIISLCHGSWKPCCAKKPGCTTHPEICRPLNSPVVLSAGDKALQSHWCRRHCFCKRRGHIGLHCRPFPPAISNIHSQGPISYISSKSFSIRTVHLLLEPSSKHQPCNKKRILPSDPLPCPAPHLPQSHPSRSRTPDLGTRESSARTPRRSWEHNSVEMDVKMILQYTLMYWYIYIYTKVSGQAPLD